MGNAALYYYPDSRGTLETIDLGGPLSELTEIPLREIGQGVSLLGHPSTYVYSGGFRVRVSVANVPTLSSAGETLHRKLMTLSAHLERGGYVGLAADSATAWAGTIKKGLRRGDTNINAGLNRWYTSGTLAAGDEVVIESANPEMLREFNTVSSYSGVSGAMILSEGAAYTYTGAPWIRHRNFYPALYWPADARSAPIIKSERRMHFTLEMELEVAWDVMDGVAADLAGSFRTSTASDARVSLESAAANVKATDAGSILTAANRVGSRLAP
jgi:hypothetical protein